MGFILSPEMMKKTFSMGEDGDSFTHRSAQHIKLFPFTANNNATIVTSFSSVIGGGFASVATKTQFQNLWKAH